MPAAGPGALAAAVAGSNSPLWYLSRGTGVVSLVLLTIVVVLGVLTRRGAGPGGFTFVLGTVHRNASLLVVALLVVHVATAVLDPYAPIRVIDAFVPFGSAYRPLWLGLGALAGDLVLALVVTSLLRHRIGVRWWRGVHWLAYAAWPVAVVHGLGTGSDTTAGWDLLLTGACVLAVVAAVLARAGLTAPGAPSRAVIGGSAVAAPVALVGWLLFGPLAPGWAARAGTPPDLLARSTTATSTAPAAGSASSGAVGAAVPNGSAQWAGDVSERDSGGQAVIELRGTLSPGSSGSPGASGQLRIDLTGVPAAGGGVDLSSGSVELVQPDGTSWAGPVTGLNGGQITATLTGGSPAQGVPTDITVVLQGGSSSFTGSVVFG